MRSQSEQKHRERKSPRLNPFQYKVVGETVSSHAYGKPESGSALALLGSINTPFSPTKTTSSPFHSLPFGKNQAGSW